MLVEDVETRRREIALRQEAHYWRALHGRAVEREAALKERAEQLERIVRRQAAQIAELNAVASEALVTAGPTGSTSAKPKGGASSIAITAIDPQSNTSTFIPSTRTSTNSSLPQPSPSTDTGLLKFAN